MKLLHPSLALAIALTGCSAPTAKWEKPGASIVTIDEDLQQCRVEARLSPELRTAAGPRGALGNPMERAEERDAQEAQRIQKCMTAKGYSAMR
jgi:hypothetical protein